MNDVSSFARAISDLSFYQESVWDGGALGDDPVGEYTVDDKMDGMVK